MTYYLKICHECSLPKSKITLKFFFINFQIFEYQQCKKHTKYEVTIKWLFLTYNVEICHEDT